MNKEFEIIEGYDQMIFEDVTGLLSKARWSVGISKGEVMQGAGHSSLVVGAVADGKQVAYARVISDKTRYAYLMDVFVQEEYRHRGIAKAMVSRIMGHPDFQDVDQWMLYSEADELYEQFGFKPLEEPDRWRMIKNPRPQR